MERGLADLLRVTIDGREVLVPRGTLVVDAAREAGVEIPVFCYHEKMHPVGACRMCLVEIEKVPRLQTACTTPVADGMVVRTDTPAVVKARRGVLEFLLTNHPLDCPVCDKGGECPLQDATFRYGSDRSRFVEEKRRFPKPIRLSSLIVLDRERCIMCTRCVRFLREVAGDESLTLTDRGSRSFVGVAPGRTFDSPFSGNTIELCPVGALTSARFRFKARSWEMKKTPSVCSLCSVGCNLNVETRAGRVLRLTSRENPEVDDGWLCDRGRFTYEFVHDPHRLTAPLVRRNGTLVRTSWEEALDVGGRALRSAVESGGGGAVGGLISAASTNEELYLFQKLFRAALKSNNVDHGPHGEYTRPETGVDAASGTVAGLETADLILLVDADPVDSQPVLDLRLKKAAWKRGVGLVTVLAKETDLARASRLWLRPRKGTEAAVVNGILHRLLAEDAVRDLARERLGDLYDKVVREVSEYGPERVERLSGVPSRSIEEVVAMISGTSRVAILFPRSLSGDRRGLRDACGRLAMAAGSLADPEGGLYPLGAESNSQGALDMGVLPNLLPGQRPLGPDGLGHLEAVWGTRPPEAPGLGGLQMVEAAHRGDLKALYLVGLDPAAEDGAGAVREALSHVQFLVAQGLFLTATAQLAHVVLPGASFAEKWGTFTNLERRVQRLQPAIPLQGEARPDWQILVEVARRLGADWSYPDAAAVFDEACVAAPLYGGLRFGTLGQRGRRWPYPGVAERSVSENGRGRRLWYQPMQVQETGA